MHETNRLLDAVDVFAQLRTSCELAGGQSRWADAHGVSRSFLHDVLNARRQPDQRILTALGLVRRTVYLETRGSNA